MPVATGTPDDDLVRRIETQRAAVGSGDPAAIEQTSQKVTAVALREMAGLRALAGDWPQAIQLYRQSLDLEDVANVRVDLAVAYISDNQPDNALEEVEKVVITYPRNARAWGLKGKALMAKNDYQGAVEALTRSLDISREVNAQYALAFSLLKLKETAKAAAVFAQMLRDYGDRAIWHEVFGGAYRETKYLDESIREFKRAVEMDPTLPHIHAFLGATLLEKNYWAPNPEIMREFELELKAYPRGYFGNYYLGVLLTQQDQLAEANSHLKAATEADPQNPDPWLYLGLNLFKSQDYANAKTNLLKTVELTGSDDARANYQVRRAYIALGRILANEGKKQEAAVYLQKAKDLSAKSMAVSSSAIASEMAESGTGASPAVISGISLPATELPQANSSSADPTAALDVATLEKRNLPPEQIQAIEKRAKDLRSILGTNFNDWGTAEARQKDYQQALVHFHEAEKWDDATPELMRNIGLAALRVGDNKEAARALQMAVQRNPQDQLAQTMLAMALFSTQQYAEAAKAFEGLGDAVYRDPRMAYAWAFTLLRTNDPNKALTVLNRLSTQALPPDMMLGVGDLYNQTGDYEDALKVFRKVTQEDPSAQRAHYYAGEALIHLDRPNEAIPEFEDELKLTPDDPNVQYHLAYAMLQTSRKEEAVALLQKIVAANPEHAQAQYQLGKALLDSGQNDQAIAHLEAAARLDAEHDYVHYQLQAAYRKAGRTSDADKELQVYREIKARQRDKATPQPKQ